MNKMCDDNEKSDVDDGILHNRVIE